MFLWHINEEVVCMHFYFSKRKEVVPKQPKCIQKVTTYFGAVIIFLDYEHASRALKRIVCTQANKHSYVNVIKQNKSLI